MYKLKGGLPYNTDCFSYWQGTIQASYAVMRQLLFSVVLDRIVFILAGIDNIHESLDEFEIRQDPTTGFHGNR